MVEYKGHIIIELTVNGRTSFNPVMTSSHISHLLAEGPKNTHTEINR